VAAQARILLYATIASLVFCSDVGAQPADANYDEAKVPKYTLPDPLTLRNGEKVVNAETWYKRRRPEILQLFQNHMYGRSPGRPENMSFELTSIDAHALGDTAVRKEVTVLFSKRKEGPKMDMLIYLPARAKKPVPIFLGLNFSGNQAVHADPDIRISKEWMRNTRDGSVVDHCATEKSRGAESSQWQVEKILARGYGLATIYYGDLDPDYDDGFQNGVHPLFYQPGQTRPAVDEWGSIGAWAWGLSRAMDYLETDHDIDAHRVAVMGHSAGGQLALCLAAHEASVKAVISLAGVVDLQRAYALHLSNDAVVEFLGGTPAEVGDHYKEADPMKLTIAARQWLVHGAVDDVVPPALSRDYVGAKQKMKENARLVEIAGAGHFEVVDPRSAAWKEVERVVLEAMR